jgi:hypothetical protein
MTLPAGIFPPDLAAALGGDGAELSTQELTHNAGKATSDHAERLGRAQAGWAGQEPAHPWLSRRWLRQYVASKPIVEPVSWTLARSRRCGRPRSGPGSASSGSGAASCSLWPRASPGRPATWTSGR